MQSYHAFLLAAHFFLCRETRDHISPSLYGVCLRNAPFMYKNE